MTKDNGYDVTGLLGLVIGVGPRRTVGPNGKNLAKIEYEESSQKWFKMYYSSSILCLAKCFAHPSIIQGDNDNLRFF